MLRYFILALARCFAYVVIGFHTDSLSSITRLGFIPLNFYLMTRESLYFKPRYYFVKRGNIFFTPIKLSTVKMYLNYPMTLYDTLRACVRYFDIDKQNNCTCIIIPTCIGIELRLGCIWVLYTIAFPAVDKNYFYCYSLR